MLLGFLLLAAWILIVIIWAARFNDEMSDDG